MISTQKCLLFFTEGKRKIIILSKEGKNKAAGILRNSRLILNLKNK
jgi:hypothetical protein